MTGIPNFSEINFQEPREPSQASDAPDWETPEGIAVKPAYGADDLKGLDFLEGGGARQLGGWDLRTDRT